MNEANVKFLPPSSKDGEAVLPWVVRGQIRRDEMDGISLGAAQLNNCPSLLREPQVLPAHNANMMDKTGKSLALVEKSTYGIHESVLAAASSS